MTKEVLDSKMMRIEMLIEEMKTNQIQAEILLKQNSVMKEEANKIMEEVKHANEEGIEYSTKG